MDMAISIDIRDYVTISIHIDMLTKLMNVYIARALMIINDDVMIIS